MNYFELFQMKPGFVIDQASLTKTYIALQKKFHPDYYGQAGEEDRNFALEQSSLVNKAYKTLRSRDLTLQYYLQWKGVLTEGEQYKLPPGFLMEVMELNEMKMDGAGAEEISRKAKELQEEMYAEVKTLLENFDEEKVTDADIAGLKNYYFKKKYIDRLLAE